MSTSPAISSSTASSQSISISVALESHEPITPKFHGDSTIAPASSDTISSLLTTAVPGTARMMGEEPEEKAPATPKAEDAADEQDQTSPHSPDKVLLSKDPAHVAMTAASTVAVAAAQVAGAAGAQEPPVLPDEQSSSASQEPREGWMPACIVAFFEFLYNIFCCCFSSDRSQEPSGSSAQSIELQDLGGPAPVAQGAPALESEIETQIQFAFARELEPMKNLDALKFPFKKIAIFEGTTADKPVTIAQEYVETDKEGFEYATDLTRRMPSKETMAKIVNFKAAFITLRKESDKLIADFQIYFYNPKNSQKPDHEHHSCSSAEGFKEILAKESHAKFFEGGFTDEKDYSLDLSPYQNKDEGDEAEGDVVEV